MTSEGTEPFEGYDEDGFPWNSPEDAAADRAAAALLANRIPALRDAVMKELNEDGNDNHLMGPHVTYGNTLPRYLAALAAAAPRDEAAVAEAGAFLEEIASGETDVPRAYLSNVAELSVIESILDRSIPAARLFIGERGGPATRALTESCAKRWALPLTTLMDPEAPYHEDRSPVRTDPRWRRDDAPGGF